MNLQKRKCSFFRCLLTRETRSKFLKLWCCAGGGITLILYLGHRREFLRLTFPGVALSRCSDERLTLELSTWKLFTLAKLYYQLS